MFVYLVRSVEGASSLLTVATIEPQVCRPDFLPITACKDTMFRHGLQGFFHGYRHVYTYVYTLGCPLTHGMVGGGGRAVDSCRRPIEGKGGSGLQ